MTRQEHIICSCGIVILVVATSGGCNTIVENGERSLHSWCEVGLENLRTPVVDIYEVTGGEDPERVCELHLFDYDADHLPTNTQMIEVGRWSFGCSEEDTSVEGDCEPELGLDTSLIHRYDDGLLLCRRREGSCEPYQPGHRMKCQASGAPIKLGAFEATPMEGLTTGAVLSVHTFRSDPELSAVTWMGSNDRESWPHVTWLQSRPPENEADDGAFGEVVADVDVCRDCAEVIGGGPLGAPTHSFVAFQTATRDEALLLAGPCGSKALVEVFPDGSCQRHRVVDPDRDEAVPEIALGVIGTAEGWVVLWTDGLAIYSSMLIEGADDSLHPEPPLLISPVSETQSRDRPSSICVSGLADGHPACVTLWTERTRFPSQVSGFAADPGAQSLHIDVFRSSQEDTSVDVNADLSVIEGFAGQVALDLQHGDEVNIFVDSLSGLLVYRSRIFGLVLRRWDFDLPGFINETRDRVLEIVAPAEQVSNAKDLGDPSIAWVRHGGFVISWMEDDDDDGYRLGLAMAEIPVELGQIGLERFTISDFWPHHLNSTSEQEPPKPVIAGSSISGAHDVARLLMVGAPGDDGSGCATSVALVRLDDLDTSLPPGVDWPPNVEVPLFQSTRVTTPGACLSNCRGQGVWSDERFFIALPSDSGVHLLTVEPGMDDEAVVEEIEVTSTVDLPPSCHVTLTVDGEEGTGMAVYDVVNQTSGERSLRSLQLYRESDGRWTAHPTFVTLANEEDVDISTPAYASVLTWEGGRIIPDTPLLSWSVHRFGQWKQRDFSLGRATAISDGSLQIEAFPTIDRPVLDSRVAVASGVPLPCDDRSDPVGDNLCAMIAYSRPDFSEYRDIVGYHRIEQLTPLVETTVMPVRAELEDFSCTSCGPVELVAGEAWRGLPTSLAQWRSRDVINDGDPEVVTARPVITFSKSSPLDWTAGTATGFAFHNKPPQEGAYPKWFSEALGPSWIFGDEPEKIQVPFIRIDGDSDQQLGSVWSSMTKIDESQDLYSWTLNFNVVGGTLLPLAGGVRLDGVGDEEDSGEDESDGPRGIDQSDIDLSFIFNDPRFLMAEHLGAAVGAVSEGRFIVAWIHKSWSETSGPDDEGRPLDTITIQASQVTCELTQNEEF